MDVDFVIFGHRSGRYFICVLAHAYVELSAGFADQSSFTTFAIWRNMGAKIITNTNLGFLINTVDISYYQNPCCSY